VWNRLHHGSCLFMIWLFKVVVSPISLWAGSLIDMCAKCGECSTRCPNTIQLLGWPCWKR
jgi:ferredoxin